MRPGDTIPRGLYAPIWAKHPFYVGSPLMTPVFIGWLYLPDAKTTKARDLNHAFAAGLSMSFQDASPGDKWRLLMVDWSLPAGTQPLGWVWCDAASAKRLAEWSQSSTPHMGWVHDWETSPPSSWLTI